MIRKVFNSPILLCFMQIKLLKDIVISVAGPNASKIVDLLYGKKNVNEFLISKKLKLTINQTRNILYKLADEGLVSFVRKKDAKKGGWYTYFWTLNSGKSLSRFKENLMKLIAEANLQLESKRKSRFYHCPNCSLDFEEENALLNNYTCPECGEAMQLKDNKEFVQDLEKNVEKLNSVLAEIDKELDILGIEEQKMRIRKMKAEQRKKMKERLERKKEKQRLEKKEALKKKREKQKRKLKKKGRR